MPPASKELDTASTGDLANLIGFRVFPEVT